MTGDATSSIIVKCERGKERQAPCHAHDDVRYVMMSGMDEPDDAEVTHAFVAAAPA
jgi:hypothetical protein